MCCGAQPSGGGRLNAEARGSRAQGPNAAGSTALGASRHAVACAPAARAGRRKRLRDAARQHNCRGELKQLEQYLAQEWAWRPEPGFSTIAALAHYAARSENSGGPRRLRSRRYAAGLVALPSIE